MTRSPSARRRRGASVARVREAQKRQQAASDRWDALVAAKDRPDLCRRCFERPHVPLHELCRACRYATRGNPGDWL